MKKLFYISTICLGFLFLTGNSSKAQLIQFSQYYSSPTILGPSFAGMNYSSKAVMNYRNQWPNLPARFVTYSFAFDHFFDKRNSGVGISVLRDERGTGELSLTDIGLQYSYDLAINRKLHARPGLSFKYSQRGIDFNKLTFGDQLTNLDEIIATTIETRPEDNISYIDASSSLIFYTKNLWIGATFDHLLQPNQSMYGQQSRIPLLISTYGGYKWQLRDPRRRRLRDEYLTFTYLFKMMGEFKQLDVGLHWDKKNFTAGLWYRGLPVLKNEEIGYTNNDAVILMFGYKFYSLHVGYSYDITINSSLFKDTGGAHEIALIYDFDIKKRRKRNRRHLPIPCPGF